MSTTVKREGQKHINHIKIYQNDESEEISIQINHNK